MSKRPSVPEALDDDVFPAQENEPKPKYHSGGVYTGQKYKTQGVTQQQVWSKKELAQGDGSHTITFKVTAPLGEGPVEIKQIPNSSAKMAQTTVQGKKTYVLGNAGKENLHSLLLYVINRFNQGTLDAAFASPDGPGLSIPDLKTVKDPWLKNKNLPKTKMTPLSSTNRDSFTGLINEWITVPLIKQKFGINLKSEDLGRVDAMKCKYPNLCWKIDSVVNKEMELLGVVGPPAANNSNMTLSMLNVMGTVRDMLALALNEMYVIKD